MYECSCDESPDAFFFRRLFPGGRGSAVQNQLYAHLNPPSVSFADFSTPLAVTSTLLPSVILQFVRPCNPDKLE
jgi:hypothetical protein